MATVTTLFAIILLLNALIFWLFNKRTKQTLYRYRYAVDTAFDRIEGRLVKGLPDFQEPKKIGSAYAIVFTFDRRELCRHTLDTLRANEPTLPILVVDNGSTDGTCQMLTEMLATGAIDKLLLNTHDQVPQWQKGYAFEQALRLLAMERPECIIWLDDDLHIVRPFVADSISILDQLKDDRVRVVCLSDDDEQEKGHPTLRRTTVQLSGGMEEVKIRPTFNGAINLMRADFFREFGYPPVGEGINHLSVEDWYYSRLLQKHGYLVAVLFAAEHRGTTSKREEKSRVAGSESSTTLQSSAKPH